MVKREHIAKAKRIVVKIGTKVLTRADNSLDLSTMKSVIAQLSRILENRKEIIIVSSGAITLGLSRMGLTYRPKALNLLQAAAAMGQSRLMYAYESELEKKGCKAAQILLTIEDIQDRQRYLNIRNTIFTLWSTGAVPIVNENDSVSFSEIRFGDNDIIAAHLSNMIDADLLLILTDTDGVYDKDPRQFPEAARIIGEIFGVTDELLKEKSGKGSDFSSGGIESKLKAADIASKSGVGVIVANGATADLTQLFNGDEIGTYFVPAEKKIRGRKKWIAFNPKVEGAVIIDRGGERAIVEKKKSLLPAGIKEVVGDFKIGSNLSVMNDEHVEIARGLTNFSSEELKHIIGLNTKKIAEVLGVDSYFDEVIHRDNMVIVL
jgi:glutamate 5-kinase